MFFLFIFVLANQTSRNMTEKTERYRAISEVAALLRESTQKRLVDSYTGDEESPVAAVEYYNVVFDKQEHEDVKRALLKMCNEV